MKQVDKEEEFGIMNAISHFRKSSKSVYGSVSNSTFI